MSTTQKLLIRFRLNDQKTKPAGHPIYIRLYVDGRKAEIATNKYVQKSQWDSKRFQVKNNIPNAQLYNAYLNRVTIKIEELFLLHVAQDKDITAAELKNLYLGKDKAFHKKTLMEAFEYHQAKTNEMVKVGRLAPATQAKFVYTKSKIERFLAQRYNKKDMPLEDLGISFITEFEHFLLVNEKLKMNSAHKYIKNMKRLMNVAVTAEWIPYSPFANFRCSYTTPEREILTQEELDRMINFEFKSERLGEIRDVFIFCCYTGFAYAEIYKFERNAITVGIDGGYWLSTNRKKTGTKESVPLLPIALEIARKYTEHPYCVEKNKLLPVNSNQKYNEYLKEIATLCNINKNITTHIARHTFATTVTLANGVPIETVSKMLGHTKLATTQIYAKVLDRKVSEDMDILKSKLFPSTNENQNLKSGT